MFTQFRNWTDGDMRTSKLKTHIPKKIPGFRRSQRWRSAVADTFHDTILYGLEAEIKRTEQVLEEVLINFAGSGSKA